MHIRFCLIRGVPVDKIWIKGARRLSGEINVHGAKNSSLPILSATILSPGQSIIHRCPKLSDVTIACDILSALGCKVKREGETVLVDSTDILEYAIPERLMCEMRSSIVFLGAMLGRIGRARVNFPGGCEIGQRPIDLHIAALEQMGVIVEEDHGFLDCRVDGKLQGASISLSFPSVGATENILLAACTAEGETVISNAAAEPEIVDLVSYLNACGARIRGAGENTIYIQGVPSLHSAEHEVIPDRIVAASYLCAGAITRGEVLVKNVNTSHLAGILSPLEEAGCRIRLADNSILLKMEKRPQAFRLIRTMPYPGFPTDAQPIFMALAAIAQGTSVFVENIFENRYKHVGEFIKMGAAINLEGKVAVVDGAKKLHGASVRATDLRGGAAMVIAGLAASGETVISQIEHIQRGYEHIESSFRSLGADIQRIREEKTVE